jgi:hypothetical protein
LIKIYQKINNNHGRLGGKKLDRINESIRLVGSRNDRKLQKYSEKFNTMFDFYLKIYRTGLIDFVELKLILTLMLMVQRKYAQRV